MQPKPLRQLLSPESSRHAAARSAKGGDRTVGLTIGVTVDRTVKRRSTRSSQHHAQTDEEDATARTV